MAQPKIPSPVVIASFLVEVTTLCEIICVHGPSDGFLSTAEMFTRGKSANAQMSLVDGHFLLKHQADIPSKLSQYTILFPFWVDQKDEWDEVEEEDARGKLYQKSVKKRDGFIRALDMKGTSSWWCVMKYPEVNTWDSNCLLVCYSAAPKQLAPGK